MMENKKEKYELLCKQVEQLIAGETDEMAVFSNVAAALKEAFPQKFFWVGFYRVVDNELLLGPFQGSVACYHIGYGKGVCGTAWATGETQVVPDVEQFPGHIACSSLSRSEIVVPIFGVDGLVHGVIDIDSTELATFDMTDACYLEKIAKILAKQLQY